MRKKEGSERGGKKFRSMQEGEGVSEEGNEQTKGRMKRRCEGVTDKRRQGKWGRREGKESRAR